MNFIKLKLKFIKTSISKDLSENIEEQKWNWNRFTLDWHSKRKDLTNFFNLVSFLTWAFESRSGSRFTDFPRRSTQVWIWRFENISGFNGNFPSIFDWFADECLRLARRYWSLCWWCTWIVRYCKYGACWSNIWLHHRWPISTYDGWRRLLFYPQYQPSSILNGTKRCDKRVYHQQLNMHHIRIARNSSRLAVYWKSYESKSFLQSVQANGFITLERRLTLKSITKLNLNKRWKGAVSKWWLLKIWI